MSFIALLHGKDGVDGQVKVEDIRQSVVVNANNAAEMTSSFFLQSGKIW